MSRLSRQLLLPMALGALLQTSGLEAAPRVAPTAARTQPAARPRVNAPLERGLIMVADFGGRIRLMDPATNSIVYDYDFNREHSEGCGLKQASCSVIGAEHAFHGGESYLDMSMSVYNLGPRVSAVDRFYTVIQRVRPSSPSQVIWKIKDLDFTQLADGAQYCTQDPANPAAHSDSRCRPRLNHSIHVVDDRPDQKRVSVVMADMFNNRVLQATLDYSTGSTLAKVDWVLGKTNPEWPGSANPNAARLITDQPGGPYLLTTFYSTAERSYGSPLMMWQWDNGEWREAWRFPEAIEGSYSVLQTPHMGEVLVDPATGRPMVIYSHSRGTAGAWGTYEDYGGTFGVLETGDTLADEPVYLMDAVVHGDDPARETKFSRDVDFLPDGSMLLTDAACESGDCANPSRLFRVLPWYRDANPSDKPGAYSPDESLINRYNIPDDLVLEEFQCGFQVLFEAEWIQPDKIGRSLKNAASKPVGACPAPTL